MLNKYSKVSEKLPNNKGIESKYLEITYRPSTNNKNPNLNTSCDMFLKSLAEADIKRDRKRVKRVIEKFYEALSKCNTPVEIINFNKLLNKTYKVGGYASIFYESASKMLNPNGPKLASTLLDEQKYEKKYGPLADFSEPFFTEDDNSYVMEKEPTTKVVSAKYDRYLLYKALEVLKLEKKNAKRLEEKRERKRRAQKAYRARQQLKKILAKENMNIIELPPVEEVEVKPVNPNISLTSVMRQIDDFLQTKNKSLEKTTTLEIMQLIENEPLLEELTKTIKINEELIEKTIVENKIKIEDTNVIKYLEVSPEEEAIKELEKPNIEEENEQRIKRELAKEDFLTRCEFAFSKVSRFRESHIKSDMEMKNLIAIHKELTKEIKKYKDILSEAEYTEINQDINNNISWLNKTLKDIEKSYSEIDKLLDL